MFSTYVYQQCTPSARSSSSLAALPVLPDPDVRVLPQSQRRGSRRSPSLGLGINAKRLAALVSRAVVILLDMALKCKALTEFRRCATLCFHSASAALVPSQRCSLIVPALAQQRAHCSHRHPSTPSIRCQPPRKLINGSPGSALEMGVQCAGSHVPKQRGNSLRSNTALLPLF